MDVLRARTVLVIVDPTAGVDVRDPNASDPLILYCAC
jgi:hypothetical protein